MDASTFIGRAPKQVCNDNYSQTCIKRSPLRQRKSGLTVPEMDGRPVAKCD